MGAPFPEPPGRAASTYRSDQMAFATAKVPDRALAAKAFVETHYRGADFLGARGASWNASTATRPEPLRGMRRDEAFAKCLSTTRDGLRIANKTPRPFGFGGDPLGATGDFVTSPEISQMFGEMIGLCLAQAWMDQGRPNGVLAELGPGRDARVSDDDQDTKKYENDCL